MVEVDVDLRPPVEAERPGPVRAADRPQLVGREDPAGAALAAPDALELAQLLEGIDAHVRVRADAERDRAVADADHGQEAVAEVGLRRRARADRGAGVAEQVELAARRVRRVHDDGSLAQAAAVGEQLDGAEAVLGEALVDLARLLVGVDVERQRLAVGVASQLLQPVARAGAHGVGGDADRDPSAAKRFELTEVGGDGRLSHALEPTARVRREEAHERDPGLLGRLGRGEGRLGAEVVELADRGVARGAHLAVGAGVELAHRGRRLALGEREHRLAPRPEVAARRGPPERSLERVAVDVDEPREPRCSRHGARH